MNRLSRFRKAERGASMVEFALLMPLLFLLLFGIIEFGWLYSQNLDVRHGAREGVRLAAVNFPEGPPPNSGVRSDANQLALIAEICSRMQAADNVTIELTSAGNVGDPATGTVVGAGQTLTGFLDFLLPSTINLNSTVEIRLEQDATWTSTTAPVACP
jgi:hypothetical protein